MNEFDQQTRINDLKERLHKALRQLAGLKEKSKLLERCAEDARRREEHMRELVMELLERQRELNVMLNRANLMLGRTQEVMALANVEMNDMVKALPERQKKEWSERVSKINELFKKTGIPDAEFTDSKSEAATVDFEKAELKKQSEESFGKRESIWDRTEKPEPPHVEAVVMDEEPDSVNKVDPEPEEDLVATTPRKTWWQKLAG